jgi:hypothetical protein
VSLKYAIRPFGRWTIVMASVRNKFRKAEGKEGSKDVLDSLFLLHFTLDFTLTV